MIEAWRQFWEQIFPGGWSKRNESEANAQGWSLRFERGTPKVVAHGERFGSDDEASNWVLAHVYTYPCHKYFYLLGRDGP